MVDAAGMRTLFIASICAMVCASLAAQRATSQQIARGRQLYVADGCYACHGYNGQGTVAPRLAPDLLPLEVFARQLRNPRGVMPIYTSVVLPYSDLTDIYVYLNSFPKPKPTSDIQMLQ
jgi:ubiquinol-cytochrome c reductase cytochrome c subunit